jgi:hypothetical protein
MMIMMTILFRAADTNNNNWVNQAKQRTGLIDQQWPLVLVIIRSSMVWRCCGDVVIKRKKLVVIGDRGLYVVLFAPALSVQSIGAKMQYPWS